MNRKIKIVGLTLGSPFNTSSRSGVNYSIFSRLSEKAELVDVFDLDLRGVQKVWAALTNFSLDRRRWGNKLHQNPRAFNVRTLMAERELSTLTGDYDLIYQDGAMFLPGRIPDIPFVSYHDSNVILSTGGGSLAQGAHYQGIKLQETVAQEKMVYEGASLIFVMSNWLKDSLIRDFGISEKKIITVYAGTNLHVQDFNKGYNEKSVLFVGNNFERKGGPVLLEAFKMVKKQIRQAKLIIVGPDIDIQEEGVVVKGRVTDQNELSKYFREASLFVLPSFFEPFGIVFAEAFAFKNPCIGTNICAMPEIIEDGKGGFLVPVNSPKILADRMITLLENEALSKQMGDYGFEKVKSKLNWDRVVDEMVFHCSQMLG